MKPIFFILTLALFLYSFKETDKKSCANFVTSTKLSSNGNLKEVVKDTLKVRNMVFADFFSPNSDGYNDLFTILNVEDYPNNNIKIVNRWGEVVFRAGPYKNDWNGKNNVSGPLFGNECQDGVYFLNSMMAKGQQQQVK